MRELIPILSLCHTVYNCKLKVAKGFRLEGSGSGSEGSIFVSKWKAEAFGVKDLGLRLEGSGLQPKKISFTEKTKQLSRIGQASTLRYLKHPKAGLPLRS